MTRPSLPSLLLLLLLSLLSPLPSSSFPSSPHPSDDDSASRSSDARDPLRMPNESSVLSCPELLESSTLSYNQSITCYIELFHGLEAVPGKPFVFDYAVEPYTATSSLAPSASTVWTSSDGSSPALSGAMSFGSISIIDPENETMVVTFVYTAPTHGSMGVLRIQTKENGGGQEIMGSPVMFSLQPTTPLPLDTGSAGKGAGFFSLGNALMWVVMGALVAVLGVGVAGGVWSYRAFRRKEEEVRARRVRDEQWSHSVPSLTSRIDPAASLRTPFLSSPAL